MITRSPNVGMFADLVSFPGFLAQICNSVYVISVNSKSFHRLFGSV